MQLWELSLACALVLALSNYFLSFKFTGLPLRLYIITEFKYLFICPLLLYLSRRWPDFVHAISATSASSALRTGLGFLSPPTRMPVVFWNCVSPAVLGLFSRAFRWYVRALHRVWTRQCEDLSRCLSVGFCRLLQLFLTFAVVRVIVRL